MSVYRGKQIEFEGIRAKIRRIYDQQDQECLSSCVNTKVTKFGFYTRSSQVYFMIEVSREMYDFDSDGFLQSEKCLQFIRSYFERCKLEANTHEVVVAMYGRLFYP